MSPIARPNGRTSGASPGFVGSSKKRMRGTCRNGSNAWNASASPYGARFSPLRRPRCLFAPVSIQGTGADELSMTNPEQLSPQGRRLLDRRNFLRNAGISIGGIALASLLDDDGLLADEARTVSGKAPIRPTIDPNNPYAPRKAHFEMPAKQVLVIYCPGAVSHVDTFDYKPALTKLDGKKPPGIPAVTFEGPTGNIAKPFWDFNPRGDTGKMVSDLLPHLARQVDDFCFLHALTTDTSAIRRARTS